MQAMRVGVVGCGAVSDTYFKGQHKFEAFDIVACADMIEERARVKADTHGLERACTVDELLAADDIDIVLNLTVPKAHAEVSLAALEARKHVYGEKPLAATLEDAKRIVALAREKGLRVGSAPDTFLGAGIQTCRQVIDGGWIGDPVAVSACMAHRGPERFHNEPDFFYQPGGGPLMDMGPYFLTAMVFLVGPVRRVAASAKTTFAERTISTKPRFGQKVPVETPTHLAGVLEFESGLMGTFLATFDLWRSTGPFEVHGTEGSVAIPNPNAFGGPVLVHVREEPEPRAMPLTHRYAKESRGLGLADMAEAIAEGRPHRANGEMALHVVDIMHAYFESANEHQHVTLDTSCERPAPRPLGLGPAIVPFLWEGEAVE